MTVIKKIKAVHCFAYRKLDFTFQIGIHNIRGINGASKTSIFCTLAQGFFNKNPKGVKIEEVNNFVTNQPYEIEIWFTNKDNKDYHIKNSRKSGKIEIYEGKKDLSLKRIPENLKLIEEILGCDYEMFAALVYQSPESTINLLETKSDGERKKFVNRINRLDEVDHDFEQMKAKEKELSGKNGTIPNLKKQIETLESSLTKPQEELEEIDVIVHENDLFTLREQDKNLNSELSVLAAEVTAMQEKQKAAEAQAENSKVLAGLKQQLKEIEAPELSKEELEANKTGINNDLTLCSAKLVELKQLEKEAVEQQELQEKIKAAQSVLDDLPEPEKDEVFCVGNLEKLKNLQASTETSIKVIRAEITKLQKSLGDGVCHACKQTLPNQEELSKELENQKQALDKAQDVYSKAKAGVEKYSEYVSIWKNINQNKSILENIQAQIKETEPLETIQERIVVLLKDQEILQQSLNTIQQELVTYGKLEKLQTQIFNLSQEIGNVEQIDEEALGNLKRTYDEKSNTASVNKVALKAKEAELEKARNHNALSRARKEINQQIEESNKQLNLNIDSLRKELSTTELLLDDVKTWLGILGSKGYRVHKVEKFMNNLNRGMAKYSGMLSEGRIQCKFFVDEEGEIQFVITDATKTVSYANWSAGEKARIKLACLFAVLELLETVGSVSFNVLCLDEIFGGLDYEGKEGLFRVLAYLQGKGLSIYTIAHSELVLPLNYTSEIMVVKDADGTSVVAV